MSMSTTERAAAIRSALKSQHGWTSRQVSVRAQYYSMGSSINVRVNDPDVSIERVEEIANAHERIDRDQFGEILGGGNLFVHVSYSSEAREQLGARYADAVAAAVATLTPGTNSLAPVEGTEFMIGMPSVGRLDVWQRDRGHQSEFYEAAHVAQYISQRAK